MTKIERFIKGKLIYKCHIQGLLGKMAKNTITIRKNTLYIVAIAFVALVAIFTFTILNKPAATGMGTEVDFILGGGEVAVGVGREEVAAHGPHLLRRTSC